MSTGGDKDAAEKSGSKSDNVQVVVRVRPLGDQETKQGHQQAVVVDHTRGTVTVDLSKAKRGSEPQKMFTFDTVFGPDAKQVDVYNLTARRIVDSVIEGYNGTIFAYGQTGTGKTFTMEGVRAVPELRGIIPNSFAHIFGHIAKAGEGVRFLVRASYLEIYNEEVRDLLNKNEKARLEVKERTDIGVYVKDLTSIVAKTADDLDRIMTIGNKNRSVGPTNMNEHSSRSHAIFSITVECSEKGLDGQQHVRMGKLHLVDLAGSERQAKTGAQGKRLVEATKINLSLSSLGNCISALVDGKSTHIPYRNSNLTRLLQDSLGGNAKTVMIANCGPADYNVDETLGTLRYANRAKNIKNKPHINEDPKDAMLRDYQKQIAELRRRLEEGDSGGEHKEDDEEEDVETPEGMKKVKKKKKPKLTRRRSFSPSQLETMQEEIERERRELLAKKDMEESEKKQVEAELGEREKELNEAKEEQTRLAERLKQIEGQLLVGGVNLLEKAAEQEKLLEASVKAMVEQEKRREALQREIVEQEAKRIDLEEKYSSLQEEAAGKTKKLKKVWTMYMKAREEIKDLHEEHQAENEGVLENIRLLNQEAQLQLMIIDHFIPQEYQALIERNIMWNEDVGDWALRGVAYTGNNIRKERSPVMEDSAKHGQMLDQSAIYLTYGTAARAPKSAKPGLQEKATKKKAKEKTASEQSDSSAGLHYPESRNLVSSKKRFA